MVAAENLQTLRGASVPISIRNDNAHPQSEVTIGAIAAASVWSVFFLVMIVLAVTDRTFVAAIELASRY